MSTLATLALASVLGPATGPWLVKVDPASLVRVTGSPTRYRATVHVAGQFDEAVLSYKLASSGGARVYARPMLDGATRLQMADYRTEGPRTSVPHQEDAFASVDTDTLMAKQPASELEVEVEPVEGEAQPLKELYVSLANSKAPAHTPREPNKAAWGKVLEPPRRAQATYVGGGVLCSPTSVSMDLGYWAGTLGRPDIDHDVPAVQRGVYDVDYNATGNWSFNVAFAASQPGMRAYVSRFRDVRDLEDWLAHDVPVACSVSYGMLKGKSSRDPDDGHLVLLVGFTASGDLVFNDPGRNIVRMTYRRADFERAWKVSRNTVYLIYPQGWKTPASDGPWDHSA